MSNTLITVTGITITGNDPALDLTPNLNTHYDALVIQGALVQSTTGVGIRSSGVGGFAQHVDIEGTVIGATSAIQMGAAAQHDQSLYVGQFGYVANTPGSTEAAVVMRGYNDLVENHGVINSVSTGLELQAMAGVNHQHSTVDNFNLIEGAIGMDRDSGYDQEIILHNYGEIRGTVSAPFFGNVSYNGDQATVAVDTVENHGLMFGSVFLGGGNDSYDGTGGRVEKGAVFGGDGADKLTGGDFVDQFQGDDGADELHGAGGDDALNGNDGSDIVDGGAGNDSLYGGIGDDTITGGDGSDVLNGEAGIDTMDGGAGDDTVNGGSEGDIMHGGAGNDTMDGGTGADTMDGDAGDDIVNGGSEADTLHGGAGNDTVNGGTGADIIDGDAGDDALSGGSEADTLRGGDGNDQLDGGTGADSMDGGAGDDTFKVDDAGDKVFDFGGGVDLVRSSVSFNFADPNQAQGGLDNLELTGDGNIDGTGNSLANTIVGNAGNNLLKGLGGNDSLLGLAGNDRLEGGVGSDKLDGGLGSDRLSGGQGKDTLTGGLGNDKFVFDTPLNAKTNVDVITDFKHGPDKILLDNAVFKTLGAQENVGLKGEFFHVGKAAADADDHIIYNKATGALSYDADGVGGHAAIQFATLSGHPTINFHDFVVI
jgi:Ca2+-binding RTX toxin-like protein